MLSFSDMFNFGCYLHIARMFELSEPCLLASNLFPQLVKVLLTTLIHKVTRKENLYSS